MFECVNLMCKFEHKKHFHLSKSSNEKKKHEILLRALSHCKVYGNCISYWNLPFWNLPSAKKCRQKVSTATGKNSFLKKEYSMGFLNLRLIYEKSIETLSNHQNLIFKGWKHVIISEDKNVRKTVRSNRWK